MGCHHRQPTRDARPPQAWRPPSSRTITVSRTRQARLVAERSARSSLSHDMARLAAQCQGRGTVEVLESACRRARSRASVSHARRRFSARSSILDNPRSRTRHAAPCVGAHTPHTQWRVAAGRSRAVLCSRGGLIGDLGGYTQRSIGAPHTTHSIDTRTSSHGHTRSRAGSSGWSRRRPSETAGESDWCPGECHDGE